MCHKVPSSLNSANHLGDDLKAEIIFDQSSRFFTSNSSYNFSDGSCSNTYCHGNFNNGNTLNKISWTSDPSATACGTCHGDKTKIQLAKNLCQKLIRKVASIRTIQIVLIATIQSLIKIL